jgi:hypothetical protein
MSGAALSERGDDLYETPAVAVTTLLERETLPSVVWEPACGPGAIVGILRAAGHTVIATDLDDWGCPDSESRRDFLFEQRAPDGCECIITNPPYKLAPKFVLKARALAPKVVMLLRLAFLESERRRNILEPRPRLRVSKSIADDASIRLERAASADVLFVSNRDQLVAQALARVGCEQSERLRGYRLSRP